MKNVPKCYTVSYKLPKVTCPNPKCNHIWTPRTDQLQGCPRCKIPITNTMVVSK